MFKLFCFNRIHITIVLVTSLLLIALTGMSHYTISAGASRVVLDYRETFDTLMLGRTQLFPGLPNQGGWYRELAEGDAFGEIQNAISRSRNALHEHTAITVPPNLQTIDKNFLGVYPLGDKAIITLQADFYAHTSNQNAVNNYKGALTVTGGPHPGFELIGFNLVAGNGTPKSLTGVNVYLSAFNGAENNEPIPLIVGQNLAWDTWHRVKIMIDHDDDTYMSITVDDQTQVLTGFRPPRNTDGLQWLRGQQIEFLNAVLIPDDVGGNRTDDDVYWDNLRVRVSQK